MSNEINLGGRPRHHDGEVKKSAIAVRTSPSIRDALKKAADESGRSITQEVEARLVASFDRDGGNRSPETERLLSNLASEIADIEKLTGKRWHKDRKTAGAIIEMLRRRPQNFIRTDDPMDDDAVKDAWNKLFIITEEREELENSLRNIGFDVPDKMPLRKRVSMNALLKAANATKFFTGRWSERKQLQDMDFDDQVKSALGVVLDNLEAVDGREDKAEAEFNELVKPYVAAELDGRDLYKSLARERYFIALRSGKTPDDESVP